MRIALTMVSAWVLILSVNAFAGGPVQSLNDLPQKWEGVAGDLLTRVPATLTIDKILRANHLSDDNGFTRLNVVYDVEGTLVMGTRTVVLKQAWLRAYSDPNSMEITLTMDDDLVLNLQMGIGYDEASNTFTMKEFIRDGYRRLSLTGVAPKLK